MNPKAFALPLLVRGSFFTLCAASLCFGQATPTVAESAATAAPPPVELSPFVVTETDDGWLAAHTVLSNRTNQPLKQTLNGPR